MPRVHDSPQGLRPRSEPQASEVSPQGLRPRSEPQASEVSESGSDSRQNPTDRQLVEGIRQADEAQFNLLYERYFQRVYRFAYARLRNRADAEEVTQETFTAVFRSIDAYRGSSPLLGWIYGIAKNTVNNHIRRARAHDQRIERAERELIRGDTLAACTPEEQLALRRCEEAIVERLASLADWQSEVFVLRHVENLPIGEIARRVSRSNDAVRSSLYRVKRMLVEAVDPALSVAS